MPFADVLPLTQRPAVRPLPPREKLRETLVLRPGRAWLREACSYEHAAMTGNTCSECEHGLHMECHHCSDVRTLELLTDTCNLSRRTRGP